MVELCISKMFHVTVALFYLMSFNDCDSDIDVKAGLY